ncbi:aspartate-semialdehyde dehydrogenase [Roseomonas sp. F4]
MGYRLAVVGATGAVGREILKTLAERAFPVDAMVALTSGRSPGSQVSFGEDQVLTVKALDSFDFKGTHLVFFAGAAAVSALHAPRAAAAGCLVIDGSGQFDMEHDVPLVVPEVNPQALARSRKRRIIANPTDAIIPVVMALKPLHDLAPVRRAVVATYQAVSGAGREAMDELWSQTRGVYVNETPPSEQFPKQIAFNCIPQVDSILPEGPTRAEAAMALQARKILSPDLALVATCVRVPVFIGNAAAVHAEFEAEITEDQAREALREAPGMILLDRREDAGYTTQAEIGGEDAVYVSRLRRDTTVPHGLAFWCLTDNLRKGAALNAVQIAEEALAQGLLAG